MIAEFISTFRKSWFKLLLMAVSGFSFDMLTGEVGADERMGMVDRFQDAEQDYFILLISTLAGGVGLNLTAVRKSH
jgi:SNF2 family DNA or RNA helicase